MRRNANQLADVVQQLLAQALPGRHALVAGRGGVRLLAGVVDHQGQRVDLGGQAIQL